MIAKHVGLSYYLRGDCLRPHEGDEKHEACQIAHIHFCVWEPRLIYLSEQNLISQTRGTVGMGTSRRLLRSRQPVKGRLDTINTHIFVDSTTHPRRILNNLSRRTAHVNGNAQDSASGPLHSGALAATGLKAGGRARRRSGSHGHIGVRAGEEEDHEAYQVTSLHLPCSHARLYTAQRQISRTHARHSRDESEQAFIRIVTACERPVGTPKHSRSTLLPYSKPLPNSE